MVFVFINQLWQTFFFLILAFIFYDVYIVGQGETIFSKYSPLLPYVSGGRGEIREEATPSLPAIAVPRDWEEPPEAVLRSVRWAMFRGFCPSGFDSAEMLSLSLIQG